MSALRVAAIALVAGAAGWFARAALEAPPLPPQVVSAPARERVVVVRAPEAAPPPASPTVAEDEPDDGVVAAVEAAVSDGTWSESDRDLLRQTFPQLSRADRVRALREITVAINEQRLRLDYDGMPF